LPFLFSLLATDRINLRTKRYRKCLLVPVYGIFYTVWYVNLFDLVVTVSIEKDMATKTHYYDAFRNGDKLNVKLHPVMYTQMCIF